MTGISMFARMTCPFRQVLADSALSAPSPFSDRAISAKVGSAADITSHESFAERQNRYPSPLQGLGLIPAKPLQFVWTGHGGGEKNPCLAIVIEYRPAVVEFAAINSTSRIIRVCKRNSGSWQSAAQSRFRPVATPCWNKDYLAPAPVLARPWFWAAIRQPVRSPARVSTSTARTRRTCADAGLTATFARHKSYGHPVRFAPGGRFVLADRQSGGNRRGPCSRKS